MKSEYKFEAYKIDLLRLDVANTVELLGYMGNIPSDEWGIDIQIRKPQYIQKIESYVCGLNIQISVFGDTTKTEETRPLVAIEAGISGLFKMKNGRILDNDERKMVLIHFPSLLMPYLRSAISGLIANAGLGSFIFPLINIPSLVKDTLNDLDIEVVE